MEDINFEQILIDRFETSLYVSEPVIGKIPTSKKKLEVPL